MFLNMPKHQHAIFDVMDISKFEFILTGSRFFRHAGPGSDWDFFVIDSSELREFLTENHFYVTSDIDYVGDKTFVDVFRRDIHWNGVTHIDVQVIKPHLYESKVRAQQFIADTFSGAFPVPKEYAPSIWAMALASVR